MILPYTSDMRLLSWKKWILMGIFFFGAVSRAPAWDAGSWKYLVVSPVLVARGGHWLYTERYPNGFQEPDNAWTTMDFPDKDWSKGQAPFGYGDEDRLPKGRYGTLLSDNDGAYFFRTTFAYPGKPSSKNALKLFVASDNAAVVYLNGVIVDADPALSVESGHEFRYWNREVLLDSSLLRAQNVLAVMVANDATSTDAFFDLRVQDQGPPALAVARKFLIVPLPFYGLLAYLLFLLIREARTRVLSAQADQEAKEGRYQSAIDLYEEALRLRPRRATLLEKIGEMKQNSKDDQGSLEYFERVLLLEPENKSALYHVGEYYFNHQRWDSAIERLQKIAQIESSYQRRALALLAKCCVKKKLWDAAKPYIDRLTLEDVSKQDLYEFAGSYEEAKDYDYALKLYKEISDKDLLFRDAAERISRIGKLLQGNLTLSLESGVRPALKGQNTERYTNFEMLSSGGMGVVYKAQDKVLMRRVAVKTLSKQFQADKEMLARFLREAQAVATLNHPNIISMYDVCQEEPPYLVMEYFQGESLEQTLGNRKMVSEAESLSIAWQVANGLAYSHSQGILHRDVKPGNLLIDSEGKIKITDFGLARFEFFSSLTQTGQALGTPLYISPEQRLGETVDERTDVYSYGITMVEISSGRVYLDLLQSTPIAELLSRNPDLKNADFKDLLIACCQKDKNLRPKDFKVVLERLKQANGGRSLGL